MQHDEPPQLRRKQDGIPQPAEREPVESDPQAFARLFQQAHQKCFSTLFTAPLTESESHHFSVEIEESTGLEVGWKSLKNYSSYLLGTTARVENPSVPTLDTLARYLAGAPPTDEERRRTHERNYPYWFRYKESFLRLESAGPRPETLERARDAANLTAARQPAMRSRRNSLVAIAATIALILAVLIVGVQLRTPSSSFTDGFDDVSPAALALRGWSVQAMDTAHWAQRGATPGHLTLFTLAGDNWPQPGRVPSIKNLLTRESPSDCFAAELRLTAFVPTQNWQQAGVLLLEDTALTRKSVRISIGFNDYSGGFPSTKEIIVQAITSLGKESSKPEEIVHRRLFVEEPGTERLIRENLENSALRIEKRGARLRLLYSAGPMRNAPFKEVGVTDFDFRPRFVALFALRGFDTKSDDIPAHLDAFSLSPSSCSP
jgi:hypothetical protein